MTAFFDACDSSRRRTSHRCTGPSLSSRSPAARRGLWVVSEMRVNEGRGRGVGARERRGGGARSQISRTSRCRRWKWMGSCGEIAGFSRVSSVSSGRVSHAARVFASRPHASSRRPARRRPSRARQSDDVSLRIFVSSLTQNYKYFCSARRADALATSQLRDDVPRGAPARGCMESS